MSTIKRIIEETDTAAGKAFDYVIQALIVVSLISFSMETLPDLQDGTQVILRYIEIFTVAVFTVEYLARIVVATDKRAYIFSFFGILIYLSGVGIYYFENPAQPEAFASIFHSLWWAISTLTTVGYGDIYPITVGGKLFTFSILIIGLGIVSVPAGILASALAKAREMEE